MSSAVARYLNSEGDVSKMTDSQEQLLRAVRDRDPGYSSAFVYGVKSTKVFCRPTCPSRKPRADRIVFFENSAAAKRAGFRSCERCEPDNPESDMSSQMTLVRRVSELINQNPEADLNLNYLGQKFETSPFYLQKVFKKITGISPKEYVRAARIRRIKLSLKRGHSIRKSVYDSGYNTSSWLYNKHVMGIPALGMAASEYRSGGEGATISYTICDSPVGRILVAATNQGVCALYIGDSDDRLVSLLSDEFPNASIDQDEKRLANLYGWVEKIGASLEGRTDLAASAIPLDIIGTAFQQKVWRELQSIPIGRVRSYSDVAARICVPSGSRAVARACASNPVALVIPCHRVVRKNGQMGGYKWGVYRKKALLKREGAEPIIDKS
jgi:AraC family transcriptional regulator, regulatory protein of adaptative response / methylated-DNA-[protein]-cysteine methyltransferase